MSITQYTVKDLWTKIIIDHLQEKEMLTKGVHIEVWNDNDKRFSAKMVQKFFKENFLNQVFTHPYTPQENGHIESFHAILGRSLERYHFNTIEDLDMHLHLFYDRYNNDRLHGSIAKLPPNVFADQWRKGNILRCIDTENRKVKFKLMIPYRFINLSGNMSQREALAWLMMPSMGIRNYKKWVTSPLYNHRYKNHQRSHLAKSNYELF